MMQLLVVYTVAMVFVWLTLVSTDAPQIYDSHVRVVMQALQSNN